MRNHKRLLWLLQLLTNVVIALRHRAYTR